MNELFIGLLVAHVLWAYVYVIGSLALELDRGAPPRRGALASAGLELTVRTALGAALAIGALFLLGVAGLLLPPAIAGVAVLLPVAFLSWLRLRGVRAAMPVTNMVRLVRDAADPGWLTVYFVALCLAAPALLPPTEFDSTMYHLAYAVDWARAGRIYVDPYLRFPLFAYNFELLYTLFYALAIGKYVQFAAWLVFAWSALGVYSLSQAMLRRIDQTASEIPWIRYVVPLAAVLVSCSSPIVLRYADVAYVDIAAGFFFLATIAAALLALCDFRRYGPSIAIIGGCFIGMKLPLLLFAPLIVALLFYIGKLAGATPRSAGALALLFAVAGSPWYLRNLLIAGDPISPILNMVLGRADPYWSKQDYLNLLRFVSLRQAGEPEPLLRPIIFYLKPGQLGEFGASLSVCFLQLPIGLAAVFLAVRRFRAKNQELFLLCASSAYAVLVFYAVFDFGRYIVHFYAVYVVLLSSMLLAGLVWLFARVRALRDVRTPAVTASVALLLVLALPSPLSGTAYDGYLPKFIGLSANVEHPTEYLAGLEGYAQAQDVSSLLLAAHRRGNVLGIGFENLAYFFRQRGVVSIGDWFGPARYSDLRKAIDAGQVRGYLRRFDVLAVIIPAKARGLTEEEQGKLLVQLVQEGYREEAPAEGRVREFVRIDIVRDAAPR